jgi:hypothetical protein
MAGMSPIYLNCPDRAEIFLLGIADAAVDALLGVYAVNTAAFNDGFLRTNATPDAGKTLNALLADAVFHVFYLLRI